MNLKTLKFFDNNIDIEGQINDQIENKKESIWSFIKNKIKDVLGLDETNYNGNSNTATTLKNARTINGTYFDGSENITTANWGTARYLYVSDSDSSNTGAATSVDGSGNATLKLPSTIRATLDGNSNTATTLKNARNLYVSDSDSSNTGAATSFDGSGNATLKLPSTIRATLDGNSNTATTLKNARTINGTYFDGSENITTANWGTARYLYVSDSDSSNTGAATSVDGSGNATLKLPSTIRATLDGSASQLSTHTWGGTACYGYWYGSALNRSESTVTISLTSPTGTGTLDTGSVIRVTFSNPLQSTVSVNAINLSFGEKTGVIQAARNNTLVNVVSHKFQGGVYAPTYPYKVWDAYTTLELAWTGSAWLIMDGNTNLCAYTSTSSGYTVKANGLIEQWGITVISASGLRTTSFPVYFTSTSPTITESIIRKSNDGTPQGFIQMRVCSYDYFTWEIVRDTAYMINSYLQWVAKGY